MKLHCSNPQTTRIALKEIEVDPKTGARKMIARHVAEFDKDGIATVTDAAGRFIARMVKDVSIVAEDTKKKGKKADEPEATTTTSED